MSVEQINDFLRPFTEGMTGHIAFTKATRSEDPDENNRWKTHSNFFVPVHNGRYELPVEVFEENPDVEWYFAPAVFDTEYRREAHFTGSNAVWIDFDEPVNWQELEPQPNIVVQTSASGKVHCYWLLDDPITTVADIRYFNKKILEGFGEGADPSGYDAGQLLKLPYGRNLKLSNKIGVGEYYAPTILKLDDQDRHSETSFAHLPEPTPPTPVIDVSDVGDVPEVEDDWSDYALELVTDKGLRRRIMNQGEDRSAELYSLEMSLLETLSADDVFRVLYRSPNDKFTENFGESAGAVRLWQDVNRVDAKRLAEKPPVDDRVGRIAEILDGKESANQKSNQIKVLVREAMTEHGKFIHTTEGDLFYLDVRGELPRIVRVETKVDTKFAGLINEWFEINPHTERGIFSDVLSDAFYKASSLKPIPMNYFAYYDEESMTVYVNKNDGTIYKLDGETVEQVPQGYNDVFFYMPEEAYPTSFEYTPDYQPGGLDALILTGPNYTLNEPGITAQHMRHILLTWLSTFFFPTKMNTRPIVLFFGEADSGKSSFFQNVSLLFSGNAYFSVVEMPKDTKDFNVQVCKNSYIFYDNVEVNEKRMQEKLAQAATGFSVRDRKLHTNTEMSVMTARAFIGITSRTVDRIQKDVAQRYIVVPVHPYLIDEKNRRRSASSIQQEVLNNRNALFSELLDFVNKIVYEINVNGLESESSENIRMRMADFAQFLYLTAGLSGLSGQTMESYILKKQADTVSENDALFPAFKEFVKLYGDPKKKWTTKELYETLKQVDRKLIKQYPTLRKFGTGLTAAVQTGSLKYKGIEVLMVKSGSNYKFIVTSLFDPDDEM